MTIPPSVTAHFLKAFEEASKHDVIVYVNGTGGLSRLSPHSLTYVIREPVETPPDDTRSGWTPTQEQT